MRCDLQRRSLPHSEGPCPCKHSCGAAHCAQSATARAYTSDESETEKTALQSRRTLPADGTLQGNLRCDQPGPLPRAENLGRTRPLDASPGHGVALAPSAEGQLLACPSVGGMVGPGSPRDLAAPQGWHPLSRG